MVGDKEDKFFMKPLIVANWKCNPTTLKEAERIFNLVKKEIKNIKNACPERDRRVEVVICPPFVYLATSNPDTRRLRRWCGAGKQQETRDKRQGGGVKLGAQNCFWEEKGAFTGEISPQMLKNLGCQYVIIGHSERRRYFNETSESINKKIKASIKARLKVIFCVGETDEQRKRGKTSKVLRFQIKRGLAGITEEEIKNVVIAYEPVWAIGTGKPCVVEEAGKRRFCIKKIIARFYNDSVAKKLVLLYGGSVNSKNAALYTKEGKFQGLLVGGASLKPKEFVQIVKNVSEA